MKLKKSVLIFIMGASVLFGGCSNNQPKTVVVSSSSSQNVEEEEKNTYKAELKDAISEAWDLYKDSKEGSEYGEYKTGAKNDLLDAINNAEKIYSDKTKEQEDIDEEVISLNKAVNTFEKNKITESVESKILGKYTYLEGGCISKFTKSMIISGWQYSESANAEIYSRKESGNTIYYSTDQGDITIEVLDSNTINMNGMVTELLTTQELISRVYEENGEEYASYDALQYWGITQKDIDTFYGN